MTRTEENAHEKYIWVRNNTKVEIVEDITKIFSMPSFDSEIDKFYLIGAEVEVKISINRVNTSYSDPRR